MSSGAMFDRKGMHLCAARPARERLLAPRLFAAVLLFAALLTPAVGVGAQAGASPGIQASDRPSGQVHTRPRGRAVSKASVVSTPGPGEAIYRRGELLSGAPLVAIRAAGAGMQGAAAACANCHRRSGLGAKEGRTSIPPITGRYLFRSRLAGGEDAALPYVEGIRGEREPYTDATLARALREGIDSEGRPLNVLMPHFDLGEADMAALIAHLEGLDQRRVPGVTDKVLHFATIITPDADPVKRQGVLAVMEQFFTDRNARQMAAAPRMRSSARTSKAQSMFMVHRQWKLHVWELIGPEAGWQEQLERHLEREPVFAVVSGLGGKNWAPVHAFCERAALPCLFPNVESPPAEADRNFYSVYFSRSVLLEADLIARQISDTGSGKAAKSVHQIYRLGDNGESGANALAAALGRFGVKVTGHAVQSGAAAEAVADALREAAAADALVLWLRPADVAALGEAPVKTENVYLSGLMGGLERAPLPPSWRERTQIAYPFDLPERRRVRVDFARGWFSIRRIPVVDEQVQADTYLALGLVSETLNHMVDTFVRDYLIERIEDTLAHRIVTGYYPRLALATGQRFASKGGYMVRFSEPQGTRLIATRDWLAP